MLSINTILELLPRFRMCYPFSLVKNIPFLPIPILTLESGSLEPRLQTKFQLQSHAAKPHHRLRHARYQKGRRNHYVVYRSIWEERLSAEARSRSMWFYMRLPILHHEYYHSISHRHFHQYKPTANYATLSKFSTGE